MKRGDEGSSGVLAQVRLAVPVVAGHAVLENSRLNSVPRALLTTAGVPVASIPVPDSIQGCACARSSFRATRQSLQRWRDVLRAAVSDDTWSGADRDDSTPAPEWSVPVFNRTAELSRGYHPATLRAARCADRPPEVINLQLQPLNLWRFYNDRAGVELVIRQLKGDYALGRIPGHHFFRQ